MYAGSCTCAHKKLPCLSGQASEGLDRNSVDRMMCVCDLFWVGGRGGGGGGWVTDTERLT